MQINRRQFSAALATAAASATMPPLARAEGGKTIALMFDAFDSDFWITGNNILKSKAKENGWTTLETISNRDQNKQNDQVKAMVERKVDGIVFIPTDNNAAIPAIRTANAANIPIIFFNRPPAPNDNKYVAIQADNRKIMQMTVSTLVDIAKKQGGKYKAVLLMGDLGDNNAVQRRDGALDVLDANKDLVEVVSRVATEWNADKAFAGLTNAIQAGEMHYHEGGSSPYHRHVGTAANPGGASHAYIIFKGRGVVQVGDTSREIEPGTLVYFPPGIPHRLRAHGGPLDYFELQAWRSFKTDVLSEEPLGLKWYYDPVTPGAARVEWDQS